MIDPNDISWPTVYRYIIDGIRFNSGYGFHNSDQGHIAYRSGALTDKGGEGDSPEDNDVYQILFLICRHDQVPSDLPRIESWKSFCELALQGYENETK